MYLQIKTCYPFQIYILQFEALGVDQFEKKEAPPILRASVI